MYKFQKLCLENDLAFARFRSRLGRENDCLSPSQFCENVEGLLRMEAKGLSLGPQGLVYITGVD